MCRTPVAPRIGRTRILLSVSFLSLLFFALVTLLPPSQATGRIGNIVSSELKRFRPAFVPGEILVRYRSEKAANRRSGRAAILSAERIPLTIQVDRFQGSDIVQGLRKAYVAANDMLKAIAALRGQPDVFYAEPNYIMQAVATPNDTHFGELYGLSQIGASQAWDTTRGSTSVVVGVVDEGIDLNHEDLQANIWTNPSPGSISGISGDIHGYDFLNNSGSIAADFHGSHVAGTIGAVGNNGLGVVGVNWHIGLMSLKFIGPNGGSTSDSIRAYNYAKQMRELWLSSGGVSGANIRILNNSYGGAGFSQAAADAINALNQAGILFVAASGNNGTDIDVNPFYPASYNAPNVVRVVATESNDSLAGFSNFGPQTATLGAPGVNILSTTPNNTYSILSGTSMASPHVAGAAALICAADPNVTLQQLKSLLMFNGDPLPSLAGKSLTERRLNIAKSLQALAENDVTPPGTVANLTITAQDKREITLSSLSSGDDGTVGQASLYAVAFTDAQTGTTIPLKSVLPAASGLPQAVQVRIPYRHTNGVITLREFDNVGNEGVPASVNVSISPLDGDPYSTSLSEPGALSTGGIPLGLTFDDRYLENYPLPFSFSFFGQTFTSVTISTNGSLYFSAPPKRANGEADDFSSSSLNMTKFKMISGLWDDLRTDRHPGDDVYLVTPDASRVIFRWQAVTYGNGTPSTEFPVNFEIELQSNGNISVRYGNGNTNLFPVVGLSGGEPEAYVITTHTSESVSTNLTNAPTVNFVSRASPPTITGISPNSGTTNGGTTVAITGTGLQAGALVNLAGLPATSINVSSSSSITATTPAHTAGAVSVTVTNPDGQSATLNSGFTYTSAPPPPASSEVVLYASDAIVKAGNWQVVADATAAGGARLTNPDSGGDKIIIPSANPADYFEMTFAAESGRAYRLWIRGRAQNDYWGNDSVHIQFSDSLDSNGAAVYRIGTTSGTAYNLEDCLGCGLQGWGWQDNGWGPGVLGPLIFFQSSGQHTIRVQVREDGLSVDQIVLSAESYLNGSPGALSNDSTILAKTGGELPSVLTVSAISPNSGPATGGTLVTISGTGFLAGANVIVGSAFATNINVVSSTSITVNTPVQPAGTVNVVVTNVNGQSGILANGFTYTSPLSETILIDDNFNDNLLDFAKWNSSDLFSGYTNTTLPLIESAQRLEIGPLLENAQGSHYRGIRTVNTYNFTAGYVYVELLQATSFATAGNAMFTVGSDASIYYRFYVEAGNLICQRKVGGLKAVLFTMPYDSINHRFLRIRHDSFLGNVMFETAPSNGGVPGNWVERYGEIWNSSISLASITFELKGGTWQAEVNTPGKVIFDNFKAAKP